MDSVLEDIAGVQHHFGGAVPGTDHLSVSRRRASLRFEDIDIDAGVWHHFQ